THVMWHRVAPALAEYFTLVIPDLRGYGDSSCPPADPEFFTYSKRAMANDNVALMSALGFKNFRVVGHDRGARVAYRMALDYADKINRVSVLDIIPTHAVWGTLDAKSAMRIYHWLFLAQPYPFPETLIESAPLVFLEHTLSSWTKSKDLSAFAPQALAHYRYHFSKPHNIRAACEDYRAGQSYDFRADQVDFEKNNKIRCPMLALWGENGIPNEAGDPLDTWRGWSDDIDGAAIESGHFVCEENPDQTLDALIPFLRK
ncbi:MAG: alpha/beta hydrolase, partial [Fimbriimonadaceae bacterium]|nr:alpha/beta hydrolase [Alphaproteobacteria bacterium]